eukprot:7986108-Heterocapsa_arctica.AAC.1
MSREERQRFSFMNERDRDELPVDGEVSDPVLAEDSGEGTLGSPAADLAEDPPMAPGTIIQPHEDS